MAPTKKPLSFPPGTSLEDMLKTGKTFDELLRDGNIFDTETAAQRTGFSEAHIRRMCAADPPQVKHIKRNGNAYFFLPEHLSGLFTVVNGKK